MNVLVDLIAGARPNFMKIAPIIRAMESRNKGVGTLTYRLVHTGQHYDHNMSDSFFEQLGIPKPDVNLQVGSGTQAEQTAGIMQGYEKLLSEKPSQLCMVVGDVTSTMACSITAQKKGIPVAHVEGGIRSGDRSMPEEINRIVTDVVSNYFFTTSETANENLIDSGVSKDSIFFVGNTMIDTLLSNEDKFAKPKLWNDLGLSEKNYFVITLHRPNNVDQTDGFLRILEVLAQSARGLPLVFPVHPRSMKSLKKIGAIPSGFSLVEPQPYWEFNFLVKHAKAVITDSGGITEETTVMGVPCMTVRDSTERPETITTGTNELVGTNPERLKPFLDRLFAGEWKKGGIPEKWDGKTGERIVEQLKKILCN